VDHQWLLPGLVILSVATAAAAITVLLSGWTGQLRTSYVAVTAIIVLSVTVQEIIPLLVRRFTPRETLMVEERPYVATRTEYTRRAYALSSTSPEAPGKRRCLLHSTASLQALPASSF